jgi:FkbM family methyltransferase
VSKTPLSELNRIISEVHSSEEAVEALAKIPEIRARMLDSEFVRPAHDCIVMTETPEGLRYFFSMRDTFVGIPIAVGVFEQDVDRALARIIRPGMNCIDVGANLGYYSIRMAAVAGPGGGRVYSFEPDVFACDLLRRNCRENHFEGIVSIFQIACGDNDGEAVLHRDSAAGNYGGMFVRRSVDPEAGQRVPLRRIDDLIPAGTAIQLVKMDVEGFEPFALRGMQRIVNESKPAILVEFNPPALRFDGEDAPDRLLEWFRSRSYEVYEAEAFGRGDTRPFDYPASGDRFTNLVCLPA